MAHCWRDLPLCRRGPADRWATGSKIEPQGAERRFRQVVEAAPNGIVMVGQDGRIALANAQMEKLFGYQREELLGQPVEMLVPEASWNQHLADRAAFFASPENRSMGVGAVLLGAARMGVRFPSRSD